MTSPVIPAAAPAARAAAFDAGGADSAAPFASALDGALTAGRAEGEAAGAETGGGTDDQEAPPEVTVETPEETTAAAPGGVVAALWALLTGATKDAAAAPVDGQGQGAADRSLPPGLSVAQGRALAHGVHGTQPGSATDIPVPGLPVAAVGTPGLPAAAVGTPGLPAGTVAPVVPPPMAVPGRDAAALAADLQVVSVTSSVTSSPPTPTDAPGAVLATAQALAAGLPAAEAQPVAGGAVAGGTADPAGTASSSTGTVAAPATTPGSGTGAGTDGDGRERGGEAPGGRSDPVQPSAAPAGPTAPSAVAPAARAEAATGPPVAQPVGGQIARHVAVLRGGPDGTHSMTVVLAPESLGRVEVSVTLSQGTVELTLRGAQEHGRAALVDALPDLRRDLEAAGLTCGRLDVERGTRDGSGPSQQQWAGRPGDPGAGGRGAQQERPDGGARPWHRSADTAGEAPLAVSRSASGLDVRV
jgi:flagellar hook-length control protein FliK